MNRDLTLPQLPDLSRLKPPPGTFAVIAVLLVAFALWAMVPQDAPLTQLELRGEFEHLQPVDVRAAAEPFLSTSFFTADVAAMRDAVAALPWVSRVRAERQWPGAVSMRVWEREPCARWNEHAMLDVEAKAFTPRAAEIPTGLPRLGGMPGHEAEVAQTWQRLAPALKGTRFELVALQLDARGEWTARTRGDIELRFGQVPPDERLPVLTEVAGRALEGRWEQVLYVDLRYTNGFATGWREAEATGGKK